MTKFTIDLIFGFFHCLKNVYKKHLNFLELLYNDKEKNTFDLLIDEIDIDC